MLTQTKKPAQNPLVQETRAISVDTAYVRATGRGVPLPVSSKNGTRVRRDLAAAGESRSGFGHERPGRRAALSSADERPGRRAALSSADEEPHEYVSASAKTKR